MLDVQPQGFNMFGLDWKKVLVNERTEEHVIHIIIIIIIMNAETSTLRFQSLCS